MKCSCGEEIDVHGRRSPHKPDCQDPRAKADVAKVAEVTDYVEHMAARSTAEDAAWLLRAARLLRRWGIDLP